MSEKGLLVKVSLPDRCVRDVYAKPGSTMGDVFDILGIDKDYPFTVNGTIGDASTEVSDGMDVLVEPELKIRLAKLGERVKTVYLRNGATILTALEVGGVDDYEEYELSCNGNDCRLEDLVLDGAIISLVPNVEGGRQ